MSGAAAVPTAIVVRGPERVNGKHAPEPPGARVARNGRSAIARVAGGGAFVATAVVAGEAREPLLDRGGVGARRPGEELARRTGAERRHRFPVAQDDDLARARCAPGEPQIAALFTHHFTG